MIGREGTPSAKVAPAIMISPLHALVQSLSVAVRLTSTNFRAALADSIALQRVMQRFLHVRLAQLATAAACLRYHLIGPRLARWPLMTQGRVHANQFRMTDQFLFYMLCVRRVGIIMAAAALPRNGLERAACGCYTTYQQAYEFLLAKRGKFMALLRA